ncbi:MAG TPA: RNA polymerase sigma factor [Opitutaceae bacterium]|nr:RNA polymerase sigma factor [Opitutaceae bacterium]
MDPLTDHELMIAVRAGEIDKLGDLFERHHGPLYGFFVRHTGDRTASEDLVQLVFYRILKYRHTYRDEGRFSAWIYHVARKVAADHFRRNSTTPHNTDPNDLPTVPDQAPHAADCAVAADDTERLHAALAALDPDQREMLVLARFQHLKHEEIARLFDLSVGAVKVRVHRALKDLRDIYFKLNRDPVA